MTEFLEPQYRPWRVGAQLFTAFAILALLITAVGVYGVMAYAVSQRTHEMGVRVALGARMEDVLRLVVREGALLLLAGSALGLAAALLLGRFIASFLYGVTPTDAVSLAGAASVMLLAGVAACVIPGWRASRVDPCEALRQD
jgi:ABC-type antimicrobial peptide transport system permease subunit